MTIDFQTFWACLASEGEILAGNLRQRDDVMVGLVRNTEATPIRSQGPCTEGYEMKIGINCIGLIHCSRRNTDDLAHVHS